MNITWATYPGDVFLRYKQIVHIIARLVERMNVEEGNKITIKYKVSFEQFMSADQASA